jgi:predicted ATPase/DNA-binding CsgD family transcriptional regulator/Tfp pilus assembly protein PilF
MTTAITIPPAQARLPAEPNSFVGRERDLADLAMLLADVRMLTLSGPGGIGKTRLATRLAGQLASGFGAGAVLVELADVADPALIGTRVATAVGAREEPDRPVTETLTDALRQRHLLLILDTCEHLVESVAEFVQRILADCSSLRIVATSREPLRVRGETVWRVPPLALPPAEPPPGQLLEDLAGNEAVRLFLDRAAAVRPGFELGPQNADSVIRLCRTLDGMPLAIELAAARMRALSAEQIAARLDDRFRLLASGDRTAPPRQQTLQAAVDWSHGLLTDGEQILLRRLSVFSGWNLEMAEQVCSGGQVPTAHVLDLLAALIDKSLVTLDGEVDGVARYRLLDTIREYAASRLAASGEEQAVRRRHLGLMLRIAEDVVDKAFRRGDPPWPVRVSMYQRIARELPNFRTALATATTQGQAEEGLRLCCALRAPWVVYGDVSEGTAWFDRFLQLGGEVAPAIRARALTLSAELAFEQQDYVKAAAAAQAAADIYSAAAAPGSSGALRLLGLIALRAGQPDKALANVQWAIAAAQADADDWEEGLARTAEATVLARLGRLDEAGQAFEVALDLLADNNGWGFAHALYGFGSLARARHDNAAALQHFRHALGLFREIDARTEIARCLAGIGWVSLAARDFESAASSLGQSLQLSVATGQRLGIARGLEAVAALAVAVGDPATAVRLQGAAGSLRDMVGPVRSPAAQARLDRVLAMARDLVGEQNAARLLGEGARLGLHEAVRAAVALAAVAGGRAGRQDETVPQAGTAPQAGTVPPAGPAGANGNGTMVLTARELQITDLIARGLSNRAIAAELVISPATAARHVANIFTKLGVTSRAQVAAWTAEHKQGAHG